MVINQDSPLFQGLKVFIVGGQRGNAPYDAFTNDKTNFAMDIEGDGVFGSTSKVVQNSSGYQFTSSALMTNAAPTVKMTSAVLGTLPTALNGSVYYKQSGTPDGYGNYTSGGLLRSYIRIAGAWSDISHGTPPTAVPWAGVVTYDGATHRTFSNQLPVATNSLSGVINQSNTQPLYLGAPGNTSTGFRLKHLGVWDRALTYGEVVRFSDPSTWWDLYWQPGRRIYVDVAAGQPTRRRAGLMRYLISQNPSGAEGVTLQ
jgi:hypothetical protein